MEACHKVNGVQDSHAVNPDDGRVAWAVVTNPVALKAGAVCLECEHLGGCQADSIPGDHYHAVGRQHRLLSPRLTVGSDDRQSVVKNCLADSLDLDQGV